MTIPSKRFLDWFYVPLLLFGMALAQANALAQVQSIGVRPELLRDVGITQKLSNQVPGTLQFSDENGSPVSLDRYFGKPIILTLVYYQCPMLCTEVLNSTLNSLKQVSLNAGNDFTVVTVSIDPRDRPIEAEAKKAMYSGLYARPGAAAGWHFLTGRDDQIHLLADAVGFRYAYDAVTGQYAHASAIMILTPQGTVSRYFYGINFPPRDVQLSLVEASAGTIGSPIDQILLFCYHFDPTTGKYGVVISNVLRLAGLLTVSAIGILIFVLARHSRGLPRTQA